MAITTAPIQAMLYDSPHAQDRSWAGTRRISHGPAIRHQQPLRPGLQPGRHHRGLGRNLDRRRSLFCAADGCVSFPGFAPLFLNSVVTIRLRCLLIATNAHAFKTQTCCTHPYCAHRNDTHGVLGNGSTSTSHKFLLGYSKISAEH